MKRFLTISSIAGIFVVGILIGQLYAPFDVWLYALYVLIYSGAIFMVGIYIGQKSERAWALHRETLTKERREDGMDSREEVVKIAEHR